MKQQHCALVMSSTGPDCLHSDMRLWRAPAASMWCKAVEATIIQISFEKSGPVEESDPKSWTFPSKGIMNWWRCNTHIDSTHKNDMQIITFQWLVICYHSWCLSSPKAFWAYLLGIKKKKAMVVKFYDICSLISHKGYGIALRPRLNNKMKCLKNKNHMWNLFNRNKISWTPRLNNMIIYWDYTDWTGKEELPNVALVLATQQKKVTPLIWLN